MHAGPHRLLDSGCQHRRQQSLGRAMVATPGGICAGAGYLGVARTGNGATRSGGVSTALALNAALGIGAHTALTAPPPTSRRRLLRTPALARLDEVRVALGIAENVLSLHETTEPPQGVFDRFAILDANESHVSVSWLGSRARKRRTVS